MIDNDKLISELIRFLRFPLIVFVVMIHTRFDSISMGGVDYVFDLQHYPIYCNVSFFISKLLCGIAVPIFFIFSGYLFFYKMSSFSTKDYVNKLSKRLYTLVLPYIFWNFVVIAIYFLAQTFMPTMISGNNKPIVDYGIIDWFRAFWNYHDDMPICYQFWFIRDLIVVVILSPVLYYAIKKFRFYFVGLMGVIWLLNLNTGISGFSVTAIFFFSLGALFSIGKYDVVKCLDKIKTAGYVTSFLLIIIEMCLYNIRGSITAFFSDIQSIMLYKILTLVLIVACLNIALSKLRSGSWKTNKFLCDSNFFIYAYHTMPLMLVLKLFVRFVQPNSDIYVIMIYFAVPLITILVGLFIFALMRRLLPKLTAFITGSRI